MSIVATRTVPTLAATNAAAIWELSALRTSQRNIHAIKTTKLICCPKLIKPSENRRPTKGTTIIAHTSSATAPEIWHCACASRRPPVKRLFRRLEKSVIRDSGEAAISKEHLTSQFANPSMNSSISTATERVISSSDITNRVRFFFRTTMPVMPSKGPLSTRTRRPLCK